MKNIILIGAGGHCKSCIDVIELQKKYKIIGIIDNKKKVGTKIFNYKIIGNDNDLTKIKKCKNVHISIGQIKTPKKRVNIFNKLKKKNFKFPVIISPLAHVSKNASIKEGTIIFHNSIINANAHIGSNTIINNQALIEHDAIIGNNCHISTGSIVNGGTKVGDGTFVGSKAVLREQIQIGKNCIIGMGKIVKKSCKNNELI